MSFQEFTLSDGSDEVMVDIDTESGKVIDLYTYRDHNLEYYSEKKDDFLPIGKTWESKHNELFLHCPKSEFKKTLKRLVESDLVVGSHYTDEGLEDQEAAVIFYKMVNHYGLAPKAFGS